MFCFRSVKPSITLTSKRMSRSKSSTNLEHSQQLVLKCHHHFQNKRSLLELFEQVEVNVNFSINFYCFTNGFGEKWLNVRNSVLGIRRDSHVTLDRFAVSISANKSNIINFTNQTMCSSNLLGFDCGYHFRFIKSKIGREIDCHFKFR